MQVVDTHCHIHFESYKLNPEQVLKDAAAAGVSKVICVGCSVADSAVAVAFAEAHDNVWASVGAHPHDGQDYLKDEAGSLKKLKELAAHPKVVAIGEIGLDYFHKHSSKEDQIRALRSQIKLGLEVKKPFIFHIREAFADFWPIFDEFSGIKGVVHSFSAYEAELEAVLSRGLYVGLNGIMTFTTDYKQLEAAKKIPLENLLLETDAPFLTPKPFRGSICESKHTAVTAEFLAHLRGEDAEHLTTVTTRNASDLFSLT